MLTGSVIWQERTVHMAKNRATEEHKIWLFDMAHGNLSEVNVVKGFIKFYALNGFAVGNVIDDIVFRTHYEPGKAKEILTTALESFSDNGITGKDK